ncbi:MAG: site-specific DNA-methyltransferase [Candidatus Omnitrophica bacterium]|nr:site-specific DNA-methyltransferase [Candidatus Omnitrophota bacterium]
MERGSSKNSLYHGDNLDILMRHVEDDSVDLVYLDPPFKSNQDFSLSSEPVADTEGPAGRVAFGDTWRWDESAELDLQRAMESGARIARILRSLRDLVGETGMLAYLSMMAPRIGELHRVLKPTGSLYLHCDPSASHYLKLLVDSVFGAKNFRTEIIWKRGSAHNDTKQGRCQHGRIHDVILFHGKSDRWTWNPQHTPYDREYVESFYRHVEPGTGRRYRLGDLTGPGGANNGNREYEVLGVTRYWRYTREKMEQLIVEGRVVQSRPGAVPAYKRYLDEMPGVPLQDVWTDIRPVGARAAERVGYPTQKPEALLERIIRSSSNTGDLVLDPFCGCGTTLVVARRLNRRWIGVDSSRAAIAATLARLRGDLGETADSDYRFVEAGEEVSHAR